MKHRPSKKKLSKRRVYRGGDEKGNKLEKKKESRLQRFARSRLGRYIKRKVLSRDGFAHKTVEHISNGQREGLNEIPSMNLAMKSCENVNYNKYNPKSCEKWTVESLKSPWRAIRNFRSLKKCQKARRCEKVYENSATLVEYNKNLGYVPKMGIDSPDGKTDFLEEMGRA